MRLCSTEHPERSPALCAGRSRRMRAGRAQADSRMAASFDYAAKRRCSAQDACGVDKARTRNSCPLAVYGEDGELEVGKRRGHHTTSTLARKRPCGALEPHRGGVEKGDESSQREPSRRFSRRTGFAGDRPTGRIRQASPPMSQISEWPESRRPRVQRFRRRETLFPLRAGQAPQHENRSPRTGR